MGGYSFAIFLVLVRARVLFFSIFLVVITALSATSPESYIPLFPRHNQAHCLFS